MMRVVLFFMLLGAVGLTACDPLAPEVTQEVIVVTSETQVATPTNFGGRIAAPTPTPVIRVTPSPTPTATVLPTATVPPCDQATGTFFESTFESAVNGEAVPFNIYLPPCFFESGRRYPYVILLHGSSYDHNQWQDLAIQQVLDEALSSDPPTLAPMVAVMPQGGTFQENNLFDDGASFETVILDELIPHLERNYCLITQQEGRAIGGISRGGFWAFSIGLRNPGMFISVGGHSPWFVPDNAPATHNPLALAERATGIESLRIHLDNAQNDSGGQNVIVFSNTLRQRNITHAYIINPVGGHDNDYWGANLPEYLSFYSSAWANRPQELPSCQ